MYIILNRNNQLAIAKRYKTEAEAEASIDQLHKWDCNEWKQGELKAVYLHI